MGSIGFQKEFGFLDELLEHFQIEGFLAGAVSVHPFHEPLLIEGLNEEETGVGVSEEDFL